MKYRITEDWLTGVFEKLFGFFDKEEVRALDIPGMGENDNLAEVAARFYARRSFEAIRAEMDYIPTDTRIDLEKFQREGSKESISRLKGFILYYQAARRSEGFGVTEISELWLLEDALLLIALKSVQYATINCKNQKG